MRRTPNLLLTSLCGVSMALVGCSEGSRNMGDSGASQRAEYTPGTGSAMDGDDGSATGGSSQNYEPNEWGAVDATDGYAGAIDGTDGFSGSSDATDNFDAGTAPEILPPPDTSFEGVGTNPFVIAASDPQSTFAADVDTASYDIFRRDLGQWNKLPHPASVRLEEYVNFFDYDYVAPEGDDPFSITVDAAPSPFVDGTTVVRVGIQGTRLSQLERKDANIVFLIDSSGSMGANGKMELVKETLLEAVETFAATDYISIVTYAGGAGVLLPPTPVSEKAVIKGAIAGLHTGGSTAGAAGINAAYAQAEAGFIEGGINHVIMCSDGDFNVGLTSDQSLVELIEEKRKSGVTFTALGFGSGSLNDSMMEKVTNAGNGTYAVIIDADSAIEYAQTKLLQAMYFIAKDMKLQVTFNPETVLAYRLLGYEINDIADELFTDDTVDAGEVGAGHNVTALYEVVMSGGLIPLPEGAPEPEDSGEIFDGELSVQADELVRVAVRWKDVDATEEDAAYEVSKGITEADVLSAIEDASDDFRWAAAIAAFAEILKGSPYSSLDNLQTIESIVTQDPQATWPREEFATLFATAKEMLTVQTLD